MTQKKKSKFWIFLIILSFLLITFLALLQPIGDYLIINDPLEKSDLITAVSGPEYRILYAAELYKKGLGKTLFFTGSIIGDAQRSAASWSQYLAKTTGVPGEAIVINETTVISTYDEAMLLKEFIDQHPEEYQSVIIVTDPYHTRRARWIYRKVLGDEIRILMSPVAFSRTNYTKYWWRNQESRQLVKNEYIKLVFYMFRYDIAKGKLRDWLARFDEF